MTSQLLSITKIVNPIGALCHFLFLVDNWNDDNDTGPSLLINNVQKYFHNYKGKRKRVGFQRQQFLDIRV